MYINADDMNSEASAFASPFLPNDAGGLYFNAQQSSEVFWRTLCMDVIDCQQLKKHRRCRGEDSHRLWQWLDWIFEFYKPSTIPQLHWHLNTHLQGKQMIKTKQGYIGLASKDARIGDKVCLVAGEAYPYVLRETAKTVPERTFELVCPSYIHGWMDGRPCVNEKSVRYERVYIA